MRAFLTLLVVIGLPIAEIWLVVWLVEQFGWGPVIIAGAAFFGFGLAMLGRASRSWSATIARAQEDPGFLNTGFGAAMGNAGLLFAGGVLLVIPGFLTGLLGLVLVFPPTRHLVQRVFRGRVDSMASARGYQRVTVIEGETVDRPDTPGAGGAGGTGSAGGGNRPAGSPGDRPRIIMGEIVGPDEGPQGPPAHPQDDSKP